MARGDDMMASFRGDEDPSSPTTIIFRNMQAAGIPLNAGNIRTYMQKLRMSPEGPPGQFDMGARDPASGNMESLRVQRDGGSDEVGKGGGSVANKVEGQGQTGNAGNSQGGTGPAEPRSYENIGDGVNETKTTSAQPSSNFNLGSAIAAGLGAGGALGARYLFGGGASPADAEFVGNAGMPSTGRVMDVNGTTLGGPDGGMLPGPQPVDLGSTGAGGISPNVSPMEMAMQRAMQGPGGLQLGAPPPQPPIQLPDQTSGPPIAMPPPEAPASVGGAVSQPQLRPSVTIDTSPQLSGRPPPFVPGTQVPGQPSFTFQPQPKLSGAPSPIDVIRGIARGAKPLVGAR